MTYKHVSDLIYLVRCAVNEDIPSRERIGRMDLYEVYQEARKHSLTAIAACALEMADIHEEKFIQAKGKAIRKNILLDADRETAGRQMDKAGIWYMPLKGAVLKDLYPYVGMREMADNDILFDPSRAEDVRSIMEESGFTTELFEKGPHDIYHKKPVSNFEMHRTLFAEGSDFYKYYKDVKDRLLPTGGCGYAFSPEDFYVYMICHEYKHYSGGGTGLRSLLDTYVYLKKKSPDMDYIGREAEKLGIAEFERGNRSLACRLFSGRGLTEKNKEMLRFILSSGTYGTLSNQVRNAVRANGGSKIRYMLRRFFPPVRENDKEYKQFAAQYPFAYRHKALIPLLIVFRAGRGLIRGTLIRELKILWKA